MTKLTITILCICLTVCSFGQTSENDKLIELGRAYKNFMFRNDPPKGFIKDLQANVPSSLKKTTDFIVQTISTDNKLMKKEYLMVPDNQTLKYIYIVYAINENLREENQKDNYKIIDSLSKADIPKNELIEYYYSISFCGVGNKNKPFDFSKLDFKLNEYNLANDTEKGIFFLECMKSCGSEIWGYMNIVKPPNTEKAMEYINKYPKFNGLKYYQYTDLNFPDFKMVIVKDNGVESYKTYFLNKYYELLIYHLFCLNKQGAKEDVKNDLMLGSILKERNLYKYTKYKDALEKMFQEQKVN